MNAQYKYFAFISYNSHDIAWGKRLQRKLESYRMSATYVANMVGNANLSILYFLRHMIFNQED